MIITIDGPSGTGKSTIAKKIASHLRFSHFDTGAMYRLAAWKLLEEKCSLDDEKKIIQSLENFSFEIKENPQDKLQKKYFCEGVDCTEKIRTPEVTEASSVIAVFPNVRKKLVTIQRDFAKGKNAVFEGRDMGTVVFPKAGFKVFLTASLSVRAERRYKELKEKFSKDINKEKIKSDMQKRDQTDSTRKHSPLKKAKDAFLVDTSDLTVNQVIEKILSLYRKKRKYRSKRVFYSFILSIAKFFCKVLYRYEVYGVEHFPLGPCILASNHVSFLDPPQIAVASPEEIHFLAKESLFSIPILGFLIKKLNSHPVSRNSSDVKVFRKIETLLKQGKKVLLFPEGERSFDGTLQPFEKGIGFLAARVQCPIIPIYLDGAYQIWNRKRRFPKLWGKIICVFGPPVYIDENLPKKVAMDQVTAECEQSILHLKKWLNEKDKKKLSEVKK